MSDFERRARVSPVEFRAEGDRIVASGVAIRYDSLSKDLGGFVERVLPGAARKTLQEQDVLALHEHDTRMLLGRTSTGTLRLIDDDDALRYEVDLPDTTVGRDVAELLRRGDIRGSSFGFRSIKSQEVWDTLPDGTVRRTVGELSLRDVSTTCTPAYNETSAELQVALRSVSEKRNLDLDVLVAAAKAGDLASVLVPRDDTDQRSSDEGRETPTFARERFAWAI